MSQQCGYDNYYLFAVTVHVKNDNNKIPGLRMYLCDETGKACTTENVVMKKGKWEHRQDTLFFWDNRSLSKNDGTTPLIRRKFYHIGDCYVVAFRLDIKSLKDPLKIPMYHVKIEGDENELTGHYFQEQIFHLPLNKSVRICNNGILENFKLVKPIQTFDGKEFSAVEIVLDEIRQPGVTEITENTLPKYAVRFDYEKFTNPAAYNREECRVRGANIYSVSNGQLHQHIDIPSQAVGISEPFNHLTESGDYYQREIPEAKDFSVVMKSWRDTTFSVDRKHTNFYVFEPKTDRYRLDSLLSRESDVYFYSPLKTMRRFEYVLTPRSKVINTYELKNSEWKLIDKREELFPAFKPKVKPSPAACILFSEKYHRLPLRAAIGTNAKVSVKDSFQLYNYCDDSIHIVSVKSPTRDFFSINQTLAPHQYTSLTFNGILNNSSLDFNYNSFNCYLTLEDNTTLNFGIDIPTISNNSRITYRKDSTIEFSISERPGRRYSHAIFTWPDGSIRAMGLVQDADTSLKAGKWQYFEAGDWKMKEVIYSKAISMSALNQSLLYGRDKFNIKIRERGIWKEPVIENENGSQCVYITALTDSLVAFRDSLEHGFSLPYHEIPEYIQIQFYLLRPGERTLKIGYHETPFKIISDNYFIIPDYSKCRDKNKTSYQITDSIILSLKKEFPKIADVYISKNMRGLSCMGMKTDEKKKLLSRMTKDETISFVGQVFSITDRDILAICNNNVYVEFYRNNIDSVKSAASRLGFINIESDFGNNRYRMTYQSKLIDERFFDAFKRLTETPGVLGVFLNTYMEAEPDASVKPE